MISVYVFNVYVFIPCGWEIPVQTNLSNLSRRRFLAWFGYRSYLGTLRRAGTLFAEPS